MCTGGGDDQFWTPATVVQYDVFSVPGPLIKTSGRIPFREGTPLRIPFVYFQASPQTGLFEVMDFETNKDGQHL